MLLKKEAVALGRINERVPPCPAVVRLLDPGSLDYSARGVALRLPWLALEYVHGGSEGVTLEERVQRTVRERGYASFPSAHSACSSSSPKVRFEFEPLP